jgi:hypothetical protein
MVLLAKWLELGAKMGRIINALLEILNESLIKSILWLMISH